MTDSPIFVIGRQYSGNTMLATSLGQMPEVYSSTGEGIFFEHREHLETKPDAKRTGDILSQVQKSGVQVPQGTHSEVEEHMRAGGDGRGEITAGRMYARCMNWVARQHGANRWVQKATSYIFYVEDILECFPEARLLFLVRNPLDLAASMKRRGQWRGVPRMAYGWNKGVRLANRFAQQHTENLTVIRYEDLVGTPEQEMKEICSFCDLSFHEACLQVPHVNRSESPYNQSSSQEGIQRSRVGYYEKTLTDVEIRVVWVLINSELVKKYYPGMSEPPKSMLSTSRASALSVVSGLVASSEHFWSLLSHPYHVLHRVWRRLSA